MHIKSIALAIFLLFFSQLAYCQISYAEDNNYYYGSESTWDYQQQSYDDYHNESRPYNSSDYSQDYSSSFYEEDQRYIKKHKYDDRASADDDADEPQLKDMDPEDDDDADTELAYSKLPLKIAGHGEKVIVIDPKVHAWGAYTADGKLIRSGLASAGAKWCRDRGRPCRTTVGSFRIFSLGNVDCISHIYPLEDGGGAPMPYCMFFNGNQGLHGSNQVTNGNISHGCVRLRVSDAKWIRFNFAEIGTKVVVKPYN